MQFAGSHILSISQFERLMLSDCSPLPTPCDPMRIASASPASSTAPSWLYVFEPSTRTRISFGSAFNLLGGEVRETTGFEHSAIAKGESLYDTARVLSGYSDIIVMRHPEDGRSRSSQPRVAYR